MKKKVNINVVFISLFIVMISLPLLFVNHQEGKISKIENKILTQKPKLYLSDGRINPFYITEFESYFNDNIGFKDESLAINILAKYKLFGVLEIPNWLLGKDGNLFYTTGGEDIEVYAGRNAYTEGVRQSITDELQYMNKYFEQQGCMTYNMFIPNKEAIYSEVYDSNIYHAEKSRLELLAEYVAGHTNLNIINVKDALLDSKQEQLYFKSYDASHWNMNGAFVGYKELMKEIQSDYSYITILDKEDFEIIEEPFRGLMSYYSDIKMLNDYFDFEDVVYEYNLKGGYHAVMDENPLNGREIDPNLNFYHFENNLVDNSETMLIVGDSYMYCFLLPILGESFEHVYFVRNTNAETIIELAAEINPTIFVFEIAERVVSEPYFGYMDGYKNYLDFEIDLGQYLMIEEDPEIHIDVPALKNEMLPLENKELIEIYGWAFDVHNDVKPQMVVAEANGKYVNAEFYYREDLAKMGDKYGECGFKMCIEGKYLQEVSNISFYVITEKDQIYQKKVFEILD